MVQDAWHPPTRPIGFGTPYVGQPCRPAGEFDALQPPTVMDNELSHTFRGMVVEEGYNSGHQLVPLPPGPNPQLHPISLQTPPTPYDTYPQAEYRQYFHGVRPEPQVDYLYGYDPYRPTPESSYAIPAGMVGVIPPTLYMNQSSTDPHRQQAVPFFDYNAQQPVSQYYYPFHQPFPYLPPPSPMHACQPVVTTPKRDLYVSVQVLIGVGIAKFSLLVPYATHRTVKRDVRIRPTAIGLASW